MIDTDDLRAKALAATPGPWEDGGHTVYQTGGEEICKRMSATDSAYIAAANPATILALLDEIEALRADARRYRHLRDEVWDFNGTDLWDTDSSQLDATLDAAIDRAAQSAVSAAEEK